MDIDFLEISKRHWKQSISWLDFINPSKLDAQIQSLKDKPNSTPSAFDVVNILLDNASGTNHEKRAHHIVGVAAKVAVQLDLSLHAMETRVPARLHELCKAMAARSSDYNARWEPEYYEIELRRWEMRGCTRGCPAQATSTTPLVSTPTTADAQADPFSVDGEIRRAVEFLERHVDNGVTPAHVCQIHFDLAEYLLINEQVGAARQHLEAAVKLYQELPANSNDVWGSRADCWFSEARLQALWQICGALVVPEGSTEALEALEAGREVTVMAVESMKRHPRQLLAALAADNTTHKLPRMYRESLETDPLLGKVGTELAVLNLLRFIGEGEIVRVSAVRRLGSQALRRVYKVLEREDVVRADAETLRNLIELVFSPTEKQPRRPFDSKKRKRDDDDDNDILDTMHQVRVCTDAEMLARVAPLARSVRRRVCQNERDDYVDRTLRSRALMAAETGDVELARVLDQASTAGENDMAVWLELIEKSRTREQSKENIVGKLTRLPAPDLLLPVLSCAVNNYDRDAVRFLESLAANEQDTDSGRLCGFASHLVNSLDAFKDVAQLQKVGADAAGATRALWDGFQVTMGQLAAEEAGSASPQGVVWSAHQGILARLHNLYILRVLAALLLILVEEAFAEQAPPEGAANMAALRCRPTKDEKGATSRWLKHYRSVWDVCDKLARPGRTEPYAPEHLARIHMMRGAVLQRLYDLEPGGMWCLELADWWFEGGVRGGDRCSSDFGHSLRWYLRWGAMHSSLFSSDDPISLDEVTVRRMIACCCLLGAHAQAAVLCQLTPGKVDYETAFSVIREHPTALNSDYFSSFWEVPLLELLVSLASKNNDSKMLALLMSVITQPEANQFNGKEVRMAYINATIGSYLRRLSTDFVL